MKKIHNRYTIVSNEKVCGRFFQMSLKAPELAAQGKPGQFLNIRVADELEPFFRRPFGIYRCDNGCVDILVEIRGRGTEILSAKMPGETLDVLGPLGKPFTMPSDEIENVVLVGGGIGVAPLLSMVDMLKNSGKKMILLYGGRNSDYIFDLKLFEDAGCEAFISTDDGSVGIKGRVSELFDKIPLNGTPGSRGLDVGSDALSGPNSKTFLYVCGPDPMMKSVQDFARQYGFNGECSCEEVMACGIGACLGCVVNTTSGYKTACHDGPVFNLQEVIF